MSEPKKHPEITVRKRCLEGSGLTVAKGVRDLGVAGQARNNLVNEKNSVCLEMAIRLAKACGGKDKAWLQVQLAYGLARLANGRT